MGSGEAKPPETESFKVRRFQQYWVPFQKFIYNAATKLTYGAKRPLY